MDQSNFVVISFMVVECMWVNTATCKLIKNTMILIHQFYFTAVTIGFSPSTYALLESVGQLDLKIVVISGQLERSVEVILQTYGHSPDGQIDGEFFNVYI